MTARRFACLGILIMMKPIAGAAEEVTASLEVSVRVIAPCDTTDFEIPSETCWNALLETTSDHSVVPLRIDYDTFLQVGTFDPEEWARQIYYKTITY